MSSAFSASLYSPHLHNVQYGKEEKGRRFKGNRQVSLLSQIWPIATLASFFKCQY
uniref:Uncharacterized protein n=1 Tax=Aquilaria malaccensis TaxID=223753 RepID=A0A4Y6GLI9_9ROSI|nr:hypothetical protein [Aquilaria malaccensis]